ncbi:MAG TPA: hypothetical protein VM008_21750 [Phycisphaerae bacterium]|nr:hypothetical protein [Phycisphaerae bacterium]
MLTTILLGCAVAGGAVVLAQVVAGALAFGAGHGFHVHHHGVGGHVGSHHGGFRVLRSLGKGAGKHAVRGQVSAGAKANVNHVASWLWGMLNFQAIVAGIAVFGMSGLAATAAGVSDVVVLVIGLVSAFVMMLVVASVFSMMLSMEYDATVHVEDAVGALGTVYLSIPPHHDGQGKVTIKLQQRLMEFAAVTPQETPLATGEQVIVVKVGPSSVMEVVSAEKYLADTKGLAARSGEERKSASAN